MQPTALPTASFGPRAATEAPSNDDGAGARTVGNDGRTMGLSFSGGNIPPGVAQRFIDCDKTNTRLIAGESHIDVTSPWAGDLRTLPVRAGEHDTGQALAEKILRELDREFQAEDRIDSITLLDGTDIGSDLQQALAARGIHVRVYEPSTSLIIEPAFAIPDGGHWNVYGRWTKTHDLAYVSELGRAHQVRFPYADGPETDPVELNDRGSAVDLMNGAVRVIERSLEASPGLLNVTEAEAFFSRHENPGLLWSVLRWLLRGRLGEITALADMSYDAGLWRQTDLPYEIRNLFTATSQYRFGDALGVRDVDFINVNRLLRDDALARPAEPQALPTWLAELSVQMALTGRPMPSAGVDDSDGALQRTLIARLQALNVAEPDARARADLIVNGVRADTLSARITVAEDADLATAVEELPDDGTVAGPVLRAPLTALHTVLDDVRGGDVARAAADEIAAHYLHDKTGEDVDPAGIPDIAALSWSVAMLTDVVMATHLSLDSGAPVRVRQPLAVLLAAAGPVIRGFLAIHEDLVREVFARHLPGVEVPDGLFDPEHEPVLARSLATAATAASSSGPWQMTFLDLELPADHRLNLVVTAETAYASASLLAGLDTAPEGSMLTEELTATATRSAAYTRLRGLLGRISRRHPELNRPVAHVLESTYLFAVDLWLASRLAELEPWDGQPNVSARRVGRVLHPDVIETFRLDWTAPRLAEALSGEWREITVDGLWQLPSGLITLVWVQRPSDVEHIVLVQRTPSSLTVVETESAARADVVMATDTARAGVILDGPARVLVDSAGRVVMFGPDLVGRPPLDRLPIAVAPIAGLAAPNFGGPAVANMAQNAMGGALGAGRLDVGPAAAVTLVDVRTADVNSIRTYLSEPRLPGFLVLHGSTDLTDRGDDFRVLAESFGLHIVEPYESRSGEPVNIARFGTYLVSPTGWRLVWADNRERFDYRGGLSGDNLLELLDGPTTPADLDFLPDRSVPIPIALANLHLLVDMKPSWVPGTFIDEGLPVRRAAREVGERFAAQFAGELTGTTIEPSDLSSFLHIESVAVIHGVASLAFLQAAAAHQRFRHLHLASRLPMAEVMDGLAQGLSGDVPADERFGAHAAGVFLLENFQALRSAIARSLSSFGEPITAAMLNLDPPVAIYQALGDSVEPEGPAAIELELLRPEAAGNPLRSGDLDRLRVVAEQHGQYSSSARSMHLQAHTLSGRQAIAAEIRAFAERRATGEKEIRPANESPVRVDNGGWVFLPPETRERPMRELLMASAASFTPPPGTVMFTGVVGVTAGDNVNILDRRRRMVDPERLIQQIGSLAAADVGDRPVLVMNLYGADHDHATYFATEVQQIVERHVLLRRGGPRGVVLGVTSNTRQETIWTAVASSSLPEQQAASLDEAVASVVGRGLDELDVSAELRDRFYGRTRRPEISDRDLIELAHRLATELPAYRERGAAAESYEEDVIRVPVRRKRAGLAERMNAAWQWLDPQAIRELMTRDPRFSTELVRIGPGLRALVHRLPATESMSEMNVTTLTHVTRIQDLYPGEHPNFDYRVWINQHRPLSGRNGQQIRFTAVPLSPFVDWTFLGSLPGAVQVRLTVDPGEIVNGARIQVGDELLDADAYAERLPDLGPQRRIVLLSFAHPPRSPSEERDDQGVPLSRRFATALSHHADVILPLQHGMDAWEVIVDGQVENGVPRGPESLKEALAKYLFSDREVSVGDALRHLRNGRVRDPGSDDALAIRRQMNHESRRAWADQSGWLHVPTGVRAHGLAQRLLDHYPAGLIPLRSVKRNKFDLRITVPERFTMTVKYQGTDRTVVDLAALVAAGARVLAGGQVVVPEPTSPRLGADVVRRYLRTMRDGTPGERAGLLFRFLTGVAGPTNESALWAWAHELGGELHAATEGDLGRLGPGAVTPVLAGDGGVFVFAGTEHIDRPVLMTLTGETVEPAALPAGSQMVFRDGRLLGQVDLSVPGHSIVDFRPLPGDVIANDRIIPTQVEERVAAAIEASGNVVPDDLSDRLSRRVSTVDARRASAAGTSESMIRALVQVATEDAAEPTSEDDRRNQLTDGVSQYLVQNGSPMSREDVMYVLTLLDETPQWPGRDVPDEVVRAVSLDVMTRHGALRTAFGSAGTRRRAGIVPRARNQEPAVNAGLSAIADRVAGPTKIVAGDDPLTDPLSCVVLSTKVLGAFYPNRRDPFHNETSAFAAAARTVDDLVLDGSQLSRLLGGTRPASFDSLDEIESRLRAAAAPGGRGAAIVLLERADDAGHTVTVHQVPGSDRIWYLDLHGAPQNRVLTREQMDNKIVGARVRISAVILDGTGAEVPQESVRSRTMDALVDLPRDRRFGRGGIEAEEHGGFLGIAKKPVEAAIELFERLPYLARHEESNIKIVADTGIFLMSGAAFVAVRTKRSAEYEARRPIIEFVTEEPMAELEGDPRLNSADPLAVQVEALLRLRGAAQRGLRDGYKGRQYPLTEIFRKKAGWDVHPSAANVVWIPAVTDGRPSVLMQHTKGLPIGAVLDVMRDLTERIWDEVPRKTHGFGESFAEDVADLFHDSLEGEPATEAEDRELKGAMWTTYDHAGALALAALDDSIGGKRFSPVALRQSLRSLRGELSARTQRFLHDQASAIRRLFEETVLRQVPDYSAQYAEYRSRAARAQGRYQLPRPTAVPKGTVVRPLDAVRHARIVERHERPAIMVGDYLDTMLLDRPSMEVNQHEAFGVRSFYPDLDRERPDRHGLLLFEIRYDTAPYLELDEIAGQYYELRAIVREAVEKIEGPVAPPEAVESMAGLLQDVANDEPRAVLPDLVHRRFPTGLREQPTRDAELMNTRDWVRERLGDAALPGAFQPGTWRAFSGLVHRSGDDGIVVAIDANGELVVYMGVDGRIFRVGAGPAGMEAKQWKAPSELQGADDLPRLVLAFTKCADPVVNE